MVLQIVLPEPKRDVVPPTSGQGVKHRGLPTPIEDHWLRRSGSLNSLSESRIGDDSLFSYGIGLGVSGEVLAHLKSTGYVGRGVTEDGKPREFSATPPPLSSGDRAPPLPTTKQDKKSMFKGYLTVILSCVYAIFILMLGVVVFIADLISRTATMAEVFSVYLVVLGLIWLIFLYWDIRNFQKKIRKEANVWSTHKSGVNSTSYPGSASTEEIGIEDSLSHVSITGLESNFRGHTRDKGRGYTFCRSRHSGSFYLKIGAAGFCFGHLIHSGLLLCRQIIFFTTDDQRVFDRCANVTNLLLDVLFPIYSFFLLFVIFKYSNVIINRHQEISRFALMHCISASLCFWFWSILRETADSLYHKMLEHNSGHRDHGHHAALGHGHGHHGGGGGGVFPRGTEALESLVALPLASYNQEGLAGPLISIDSILRTDFFSFAERYDMVFDFLNATSAFASFYDPCVEFSPISTIVLKMSPYLYPFSIEYSILIVGVLFIMWQNIGKGEERKWRRRFQNNYRGSPGHHEEDTSRSGGSGESRHHQYHEVAPTSFTNHLVIHADCHSANKGLFAGLLVLVGTVVSVIIFYIALDDSSSGFAAQWVNLTSQAILLLLMILTVLIAYRQITKLDVNMHPVSLLDDLLLFFCLPSFFLYTIFTVVPAMAHRDYYAIVVCMLQVIQVILQTPCIIDGLRRCSNTEKLRSEKPGRELVTFLIVCNLAMWLIETFEIKSALAQHEQISFYGSILWTLLSHMTLPLTLFYRFHSSVCLVDIWKSAYESGE